MGIGERDQIVVKTNHNIYNLYEIQLFYAFNKLEDGELISYIPDYWIEEDFESVLLEFLEKEVSLEYVKGNNLFIPFSDPEIDLAFRKAKEVFSDEQWNKFLRTWGISQERVYDFFQSQWRYRKFILEFLPSRSKISKQKISDYYQKNKEIRYENEVFFKVKDQVRSDLLLETRTEEFRRWVVNEIKRNRIQRMSLQKKTPPKR